MTPEQKAAFVFANSVAAMIELQGMLRLNADRERDDLAPAYSDDMIYDLLYKYRLGQDDIMGLYNDEPAKKRMRDL